MKFSQIEKGTRARRRVSFPTNTGVACECEVRVLSAADVEQIYARAMQRTKELGATAVASDVVFDLEVATEHVLECCVDATVRDREERYFASADEIKNALDQERIAYIFEQQRDLQRETAPLQRDLGKEEWMRFLVDAATPAKEGDEDPFSRSWKGFASSLQKNCVRTLASQYLSLLLTKSPSATDDSANTLSDTASASGS